MRIFFALLIAVAFTTAPAFGLNIKVRLDLAPGDAFLANGSGFSGSISIGTFEGTVNFGSDSPATLFSKWLPANGGAQVNTADDQQQSTRDVTSHGNGITVTNGLFNPVIRTASVGNNNVLPNDPDPGPTSFYNTFYEGKPLYLWVSDAAPGNLGASTTYSIFNTGLVFDNRFNVVNGFSQVNVDVNDSVLTLAKSGGVTIGATPPPDSDAVISFSQSSMNVSESGGAMSIVATRAGNNSATVTVSYAFGAPASGGAAIGVDYTTPMLTGVLTFGPNVTSQTIPFTAISRSMFQSDRIFNVTLSAPSPSADAVLGSPSTIAVTITDNPEPAGTLQWSAASYGVNENGGPAALSVTRTGGTYGPLSATVATANGSALAGQDYTALSGDVVSFADGDAVAKPVNVPITDDALFEGPDESFTATLTAGGGTTLGAPATATVTIAENDAVPAVGSLSFATAGVLPASENGGTVTISVNRLASSVGDTSVSYAVAGGTAVAGTDYDGTASPLTGTLSWVGADTTPKNFQIRLIDNAVDAPDKTFQVTLSNPLNGAIITGTNPATVTIVDDDLPVTVSFAVAAVSVAETAGQVELVIQRGGSTADSVFVVLTTSGVTPGVDSTYVPVINRVLTFAPGQATQSVFVTIKNDKVFKGDRIFNATLFNPGGGATLGANAVEAITIREDEPPKPGKLSLSAASYSAREATSPATSVLSFTVVRSGGSDTAVGVKYALIQLSATEGTDYTGTGGTVDFAQGETRKTVTVPIVANTEIEARETFSIVLSAPTGGATLGTRTSAVATIIDDDTVGTFNVSPTSVAVNEPANPTAPVNATVTVVRSGELAKTFTVNYRTVPGTASAGLDFTPMSGTLTFGPDVTSQTVSIPILEDALPEGAESFKLLLSLPSFPAQTAKLGSQPSGTITIGRSGTLDQPDALVAVKGSPFVGKNIYSTTGDGQVAAKIGRGSFTATFTLRVINDGNVLDSLLVRGVASGTAGFAGSARYFRNGREITARVAADGYAVANLPPGGVADIEVRITMKGAKAFTGYGAAITTSSAGTPAKLDVARVIAISQ